MHLQFHNSFVYKYKFVLKYQLLFLIKYDLADLALIFTFAIPSYSIQFNLIQFNSIQLSDSFHNKEAKQIDKQKVILTKMLSPLATLALC